MFFFKSIWAGVSNIIISVFLIFRIQMAEFVEWKIRICIFKTVPQRAVKVIDLSRNKLHL